MYIHPRQVSGTDYDYDSNVLNCCTILLSLAVLAGLLKLHIS